MQNSNTALSQTYVYGAQGIFKPLNDLIDNYGFEIKKLFAYNPDARKLITMPDGNIYGLTEYEECFHCYYASKMWINEKWLSNLGMESPKTTEEFYRVLKAFKDQDANRNGDSTDEIPLSGTLRSWHSNVDTFIMNAFIYSDDGDNLDFHGPIKAC